MTELLCICMAELLCICMAELLCICMAELLCICMAELLCICMAELLCICMAELLCICMAELLCIIPAAEQIEEFQEQHLLKYMEANVVLKEFKRKAITDGGHQMAITQNNIATLPDRLLPDSNSKSNKKASTEIIAPKGNPRRNPSKQAEGT